MKTEPANELILNLRILEARLGLEEHGNLTFLLRLDNGTGTDFAFGNWNLYPGDPGGPLPRPSLCGHCVGRLLHVAGAQDWGNLPGRHVRGLIREGRLAALGHILRDQRFDPKEVFG